MTMETDKYLAAVDKRFSKIADPVARARAASDEIEALGSALERLGSSRAHAVREARESLSAVEVASRLGVSRARVYQIAQES